MSAARAAGEPISRPSREINTGPGSRAGAGGVVTLLTPITLEEVYMSAKDIITLWMLGRGGGGGIPWNRL